jgi:hypothetical protein
MISGGLVERVLQGEMAEHLGYELGERKPASSDGRGGAGRLATGPRGPVDRPQLHPTQGIWHSIRGAAVLAWTGGSDRLTLGFLPEA